MFQFLPAAWLAVLSAIAAPNALAQAMPSHPPGPAEPPALPYRSAFEGYRPFQQDDKAVDWKQANDTVNQRGGWRAYAKEATAEGGAQADPKADPHAGHAGHAMPAPAAPASKEQQR
ncbi:hypothetical protein ACIPRI_03110 [Variovorax sp. LARHSF232]